MSTTTPEQDTPLAQMMREAVAEPGTEPSIPADALKRNELREPEEAEIEVDHDTPLDDLEIQVAHREWTVAGDITVLKRDNSTEEHRFERVYVQKPLSLSSMLAFTGLIGQKISEAMKDGLSLDGVMNQADGLISAGSVFLSQEDFASMDQFVRSLAKMAEIFPSIIEDCQCIWLRVPFSERPAVKEIWSRSPEDGGLSISDGEDMIELFIAQNFAEVEDFFAVRLPRMLRKIAVLRERKRIASRSSKHSSSTRASTQNQ